MQTGLISFCDRIAMNIKSNETKDVILKDLETRFHVKILQKHWHRLDTTSCSHIQARPHYVTLRSNGNPYYMYLTTYEDTPLIYFIDKKIQPKYTHPRIILGRGLFHPDVFKNTLLEGEMVKKTDGTWTFLINDIYAYHNQWLENYHLPYRMAYASTLFQKEYTPDPVMDVCSFQLKYYLPATQGSIDALLDVASKLPYTNRGIYFWPTSMKQKPKLFNFDESLILQVKPKIKEVTEFRMATGPPVPTSVADQPPQLSPSLLPEQVSNSKITIKDGEKVFLLQKTEHPDVYHVLDSDGTKSYKKVGMAHIPNLKTSSMLHDIFKEVNVITTIPFRCKFHETFQKWTPIERVAA